MHPNRKKGTRENALDKYYTKRSVARQCLNELGDLSQYDLVIEPSAGDGAFYDLIEHENKVGIDIDPRHEDIVEDDWMRYCVSCEFERVLVVGNPPFGLYHKLSSAFIAHAMWFGNVQTVAFILPNVYNKHTRQKILPLHWRIKSITDLGRDAFVVDGRDYHVPASFFVFDKSEGLDLRVDTDIHIEAKDFEFGNKDDFNVFVFGTAPNRAIQDPQPNNRGYYIKSKIPVPEFIEKIKQMEWVGNSCAKGGVYWLKQARVFRAVCEAV